MNLNIKAEKENTFDAIVLGTGISGGWAAKQLTESGLKTLVLERGRDVKRFFTEEQAALRKRVFRHLLMGCSSRFTPRNTKVNF